MGSVGFGHQTGRTMPNSVESEAKRVVSRLDPENIDRSLDILEDAVTLVERGASCVGCKIIATPEPQPRISTRTIAWGALVAALFLPPLVPLDEIIGTATAFRGPAVGVHELTVVNPTVRLGEPLIIKTKSEYIRMCTWRWVMEWRNADNNEPIAMTWHTGSAHVIGKITEHVMAFDLPHGITPGNYVYHESATGDCGHGDVAQIIDKDVAFTVVD